MLDFLQYLNYYHFDWKYYYCVVYNTLEHYCFYGYLYVHWHLVYLLKHPRDQYRLYCCFDNHDHDDYDHNDDDHGSYKHDYYYYYYYDYCDVNLDIFYNK